MAVKKKLSIKVRVRANNGKGLIRAMRLCNDCSDGCGGKKPSNSK